MSEAKVKLVSAILSLILVTILGTLGLTYFENWSIFNALWVTLVSLTTTGYGDIVPTTAGGRIFLLLILVSGVGVVAYSLGAVTNILVENQISRVMERNKMSKIIGELRKHIIVCGAGRVGSNVAHILRAEGVPYILLELDPLIVSQREEEGHLILQGDSTHDDVLLKAGITHAFGIVCALPEDAHNLYITMTARDHNSQLKIVSRAERPETIDKLRRAGADRVVSPTQIGGFQMATAILKPTTVDLVDTLFTSHNMQVQMEELFVTESSVFAHQQIKNAFKNKVSKVRIVAIIRDEQVRMDLHGDVTILPGDSLVLIGSKEDLEKIEQLANLSTHSSI